MLRELYREEARCQIIADSALQRGLADPYLIEVNGRLAGYGAVWNQIDKDRLTEFYTLPQMRAAALPMFRELLRASRAKQIAVQTNIPLLWLMLYDCAHGVFRALADGEASPG